MSATSVAIIGVLIILAVVALVDTDYRNGHAPGDTEIRETAKVYHLKDGVFVHETREGQDHYFLLEGPMESFELTPDGVSIVLESSKHGFIITWSTGTTLSTPRQTGEWIVGFLNTEPKPATDQSLYGQRGATRMSATPIRLDFMNTFNEETSVKDIYMAGR